MNNKISIILPVRNEERYINKCLDSILKSTYPLENIEIIIVDGMSTDSTVAIISKYQKEYKCIKLVINEKKIVPVSLNIGIKLSKGDYMIRLDAHSTYPPEYFSKLIYWANKLNADNVGAVVDTDVLRKTKESIAIKKVMSDKFGVGNSLFRIGINTPKLVDTVPFGCYRRNIFDRFGYFDERLVRNQDIEFNKRIARNGAKIYLIPDIKLKYFARDTYMLLFKNRFNTGKWIIKTSYFTNTFSNLGLRHFIPMIFVLSLIIPSLMFFIHNKFIYISFLFLLCYLSMISFRSFHIVDNNTSVLHLVFAFITLHISYGLGSVSGIFECILRKIGFVK